MARTKRPNRRKGKRTHVASAHGMPRGRHGAIAHRQPDGRRFTAAQREAGLSYGPTEFFDWPVKVTTEVAAQLSGVARR